MMLCARYAMPGTDAAYGGVSRRISNQTAGVVCCICLRMRSAISDSDVVDGANSLTVKVIGAKELIASDSSGYRATPSLCDVRCTHADSADDSAGSSTKSLSSSPTPRSSPEFALFALRKPVFDYDLVCSPTSDCARRAMSGTDTA
eukprot:2244578-Rhodomonas_salina.6